MMRKMALCVAAMLLIATSAAAQDRTGGDRYGSGGDRYNSGGDGYRSGGDHHTTGAYDRLSPGQQSLVDALYEAQFGSRHHSRHLRRLSRDDIAMARQGGGWGKIFKEFKAQGYFPNAKNFGQVVSRFRLRQNRLRHSGYSSHVVITTGSGRRIDYRRVSRHHRTGDRDGRSRYSGDYRRGSHDGRTGDHHEASRHHMDYRRGSHDSWAGTHTGASYHRSGHRHGDYNGGSYRVGQSAGGDSYRYGHGGSSGIVSGGGGYWASSASSGSYGGRHGGGSGHGSGKGHGGKD